MFEISYSFIKKNVYLILTPDRCSNLVQGTKSWGPLLDRMQQRNSACKIQTSF